MTGTIEVSNTSETEKKENLALGREAGKETQQETGVQLYTANHSGQSHMRCGHTERLKVGVEFRKTTLLDVCRRAWRGDGPVRR